MSDASPVYAPNHPDVAHESFDDEVILIHFGTGRYFRLDAAGRVAWSEIERGANAADVARALGGRFDASPAALEGAAASFLAALSSESLIVPRGVPRGANGAAAPAAPAAPPAPRAPLIPPRLEVFTDLQDLLLLDPIHDVDEVGWPHAR